MKTSVDWLNECVYPKVARSLLAAAKVLPKAVPNEFSIQEVWEIFKTFVFLEIQTMYFSASFLWYLYLGDYKREYFLNSQKGLDKQLQSRYFWQATQHLPSNYKRRYFLHLQQGWHVNHRLSALSSPGSWGFIYWTPY